jgi:hypothetical protein
VLIRTKQIIQKNTIALWPDHLLITDYNQKFTSNITTASMCPRDHNHCPITRSQCTQGKERVAHRGGGDVVVDVVEAGGGVATAYHCTEEQEDTASPWYQQKHTRSST